MPFAIHRGTNISHWLSQSPRRGAERVAFFTETDVKRLKEYGFDHLRLPADEEQLWDRHGRQEPEAFALLDSALDWCGRAGLRVILDLHILRSHYFNQETAPALYTDPKEGAKFVDLWRQLSAHLKPRPVDQVAYELMNEPVASDPEDWNRVALPVFAELRRLEPERYLVLGSNEWSIPDTFDRLRVPKDPRCILTFHFYRPMFITHYQASWWDGGSYAGPVHYPGQPIGVEDWERLDPAFRTKNEAHNEPFGLKRMEFYLSKALEVARREKLMLYCGEFGCYDKCPQPLRLAWYRDILALFKKHDIAWANWDYKGGFGIVTVDGKDTGIAQVLLGR